MQIHKCRYINLDTQCRYTNVDIHKCREVHTNCANTNIDTQMQIHKCRYTNVDTQMQIHKCRYTNVDT